MTNSKILSLNCSANYSINAALAARVHTEIKPNVRKQLADPVISIRTLALSLSVA
jgi:hypothetical protein